MDESHNIESKKPDIRYCVSGTQFISSLQTRKLLYLVVVSIMVTLGLLVIGRGAQ